MHAFSAEPVPAHPLPADAGHSRFVQRVRRRWGEAQPGNPLPCEGLPDRDAMGALLTQLQAEGRPLPSALRWMRHAVIERLAVEDVERHATVAQVTAAVTTLAEVALQAALAAARQEADERFGPPVTAQGEPIELWIVGMGKLGARELNVSSDIDLVYVCEDVGHTTGPRPVSSQEYFAFVAKRLYALIGDTTDDGLVFRVDLALRPNGQSGPPVVSLAMLEEYFQVQGREWERFAWLKSRVVAPRAAIESGRAQALAHIVTPFVYRRYLDYGVFEGLRQLHHKIRTEAQRRAAGRPERHNDVKLSRGGIREIEFTVQLLQVVRGGQFPEIRTRSTVKALQYLTARGLMKPATAAALSQAYEFLRRVEHRIQYLDDQQTHVLPSTDDDLTWIAASMGLACNADACELLDRLCAVRELVAAEFDALLHDKRPTAAPGAGCKTCGPGPVAIDAEAWADRLPRPLAQRVAEWVARPRVQNLRDDSKQRLARLVMRAGEEVQAGRCTDDAAVRFIDWMEPLLRRESYIALLVERPAVQQRLLRLLGSARWPMRYLMQHPGVIDELADARMATARFDRAAFVAELDERHAAWQRAGELGEEALLDTLRRAHHAEVFRTLVLDVEGTLSVEAVADDLSSAADAVLEVTLRWAWHHIKQRHRESPLLAIVAYGKLGGKELGYGSDLDVVFVFDDRDEADSDRALEAYGALVRRLITWLTVRTAAGELFDIDTALRPNGNSGLLVTSLTAFEQYQRGRGSNTAWTWEHQALSRARCCVGPALLCERIEAIRREVLRAPRDRGALAQEVLAMREKVRSAHPVKDGCFDVKHSRGGMMDVEFAVQYLVLAHSAEHPELLDNAGNIALLHRAEAAGLLAAHSGSAAADAYRSLRRSQHQARLNEQSSAFNDPAPFAQEQSAVAALTRQVFGA